MASIGPTSSCHLIRLLIAQVTEAMIFFKDLIRRELS